MTNLIFRAIASISSLLKRLQVKSIISIALLGVLLLTTNVNAAQNSQEVTKRIDQLVHQDDSQRPKTLGDFEQEVEGDVPLGERVYNTARDSAEAFKDFGSVYPDTAKKSARALENNSKESLNQKNN
jgi:hypothetical protein